MSPDRQDIDQALEIACGAHINADVTSRRTASQRDVDRTRAAVRRFLAELPPETSVHEILEVIDD